MMKMDEIMMQEAGKKELCEIFKKCE